MQRAAVLAVVATLSVAACSSGSDDAEPRTTVPSAPALTTTTNPYAVPEVIDVAYVNRVLAGLDAAVGDVLRIVVPAKTLTPEALERLEHLYSGEALTRRINGFIEEAKQGFEGYRSPVGNHKTTVTELLEAKSTCVFTHVNRDYKAVGLNPDPIFSDLYVAMKPKASNTADPFNPTPWIMIYDGYTPDRSRPMNPCADVS